MEVEDEGIPLWMTRRIDDEEDLDSENDEGNNNTSNGYKEDSAAEAKYESSMVPGLEPYAKADLSSHDWLLRMTLGGENDKDV